MSDDHATQAMSAYGSYRNQTPHMDKLAAEGMRFDRCFAVNAICGPSRAAIISGQYGHVTGFLRNSMRFSTDRQTFPRMLQQNGYQTCLVGKWHLSQNDVENPPMGFDYWNVLPGQGAYVDPVMFEGGARKQYEGYTPDLITDMALDFLKARDPNRPFLVMVHHKAPHSPWQFPARHEAMLDGKTVPEPDNLWDDHSGHSRAVQEDTRNRLAGLQSTMERESWATGPLDTDGLDDKAAIEATYQKFVKDYLRTVQAVDDSVGRLVDYIDAEGLTDDTVVVYCSDQGFFLGEHGWHNKRMAYEESIRMPLVVRYPPEIEAGSVNSDIVLNIDFAETLLDYAGSPAAQGMQGRSVRPLLRGETPGDWRKSMFYRYYQGDGVPLHYGVRTERHKLLFYTATKEWELFDLESDPSEMSSVYGNPAYAEVVNELKDELDRLCEELDVTAEFLDDYVPVEVP